VADGSFARIVLVTLPFPSRGSLLGNGISELKFILLYDSIRKFLTAKRFFGLLYLFTYKVRISLNRSQNRVLYNLKD